MERINAHGILTKEEGREYVTEECFFSKEGSTLVFWDGVVYNHVTILGDALIHSDFAFTKMYTFLMGYVAAKRGTEWVRLQTTI